MAALHAVNKDNGVMSYAVQDTFAFLEARILIDH
jgi:hypothetical protein